MQHERRHNPYPWTWEIPLGLSSVVLLVLAVGVHLGNGLAHLTAGGGWRWPAQHDLFATIPTVWVAGSATNPTVHAWIIAIELLLVCGLGWATLTSWQRWGPTRLRGMASRTQAEHVLGVARLQRVAPIVRPDLQPTRQRRTGGRR